MAPTDDQGKDSEDAGTASDAARDRAHDEQPKIPPPEHAAGRLEKLAAPRGPLDRTRSTCVSLAAELRAGRAHPHRVRELIDFFREVSDHAGGIAHALERVEAQLVARGAGVPPSNP